MDKIAGVLPLLFLGGQVLGDIISLENGQAPRETPAPSPSMMITFLHILANGFLIDFFVVLYLRPEGERVGRTQPIIFLSAFTVILGLRVLAVTRLRSVGSLAWLAFDSALLFLQLKAELGKLQTYLTSKYRVRRQFSRPVQLLIPILMLSGSKIHWFGDLVLRMRPSYAAMVIFLDFALLCAWFMVNFERYSPKKKHFVKRRYFQSPYTDILAEVQANRATIFPDEQSQRSLDASSMEGSVSMTEIIEADQSQVRWVVFEHLVCELGAFIHPGGTFIFDLIGARDVTGIFYGSDRLYFFEKNRLRVSNLEHKHSKLGKMLLKENAFGTFSFPIFTADELEAKSGQGTELLPGLSSQSPAALPHISALHPEIPPLPFLNLQADYFTPLGHTKYGIVFLKRKRKSRLTKNRIDLARDWRDWIGRYCIWKVRAKERKLVRPLIFLNPQSFRLRNRQILAVSEDLFDYNKRFMSQEMVKMGAVKEGTLGESTSEHFPVFHKAEGGSIPGTMELSDLIGNNFSFLYSSPKRVFFIIKDAGVVPLLDFFDQKLRHFLTDIASQSSAGRFLTPNDIQSSSSGIKATVYWEVSPKFGEAARTLGLYHLQLLKEVQRRPDFRAAEFVRDVFIDSDSVDFQMYNHTTKVRLKQRTLLEILKLAQGKYDRIVVLGSNKFKTWLLGSCRILPEIFAQITVI